MSKACVCRIISEMLIVFESHLCCKWIKLGKTNGEETATKEAFYSLGGLPGVVGCVDGTHVKIKSPGRELAHLYYNRKGYYSLNVMLVRKCI